MLRDAAVVWRAAGNLEAAENALLAALDRDVSIAAHDYVEVVLFNRGYAAAAQFLNEFSADHPDGLLLLAQLHRRAGHIRRAEAAFSKAVNSRVDGAALAYSRYLRQLGRHDDALQITNHIDPSSGDRWEERVKIFSALGDDASLQMALEVCFGIDAGMAGPLAQFHSQAGRLEEAKALHLKAVDRGRPQSLVDAADIALLQSKKDPVNRTMLLEEAQTLLRRAWEDHSVTASLPKLVAVLIEAGLAPEADFILDGAAAGKNSFLPTLGSRLERKGDLSGAEKAFREATELDLPNSYRALHDFYIRRDNPAKTEAVLITAGQKGEPNAIIDLARHYAANDDPIAADFYYSFAMTPGIKPFAAKSEAVVLDFTQTAPSIIREYAEFLLSNDDLDAALSIYDSWIDRGQTAFLLDQAALYRKVGNMKEAESKLVRATAVLVPGSFEELGLFLSDKGEHGRAAHAFRKAFNTGLSQRQTELKALAARESQLAIDAELGLA